MKLVQIKDVLNFDHVPNGSNAVIGVVTPTGSVSLVNVSANSGDKLTLDKFVLMLNQRDSNVHGGRYVFIDENVTAGNESLLAALFEEVATVPKAVTSVAGVNLQERYLWGGAGMLIGMAIS